MRKNREIVVKSLYEMYPFPDRTADHVGYARIIIDALRRLDVRMNNWKWLDLGCGTGEITIALGEISEIKQMVGIDFSKSSLKKAYYRASISHARDRLQFFQCDILSLPFKEVSFDIVSAFGSLHCLEEPIEGFKSSSRLLRKNGYFIAYYYGKYGRFDIQLKQKILNILIPDTSRFQQRVDMAKRLFQPKMHTGDEMEDQWIADQYAHPCEHVYGIVEIMDILEESGMELFEWLFVPENAESYFTDEVAIEAVNKLPRRERLHLLDLFLKKQDNLIIAVKK